MKKTTYSITIPDLLKRPDIRNDFDGNAIWMNKMTDDELKQFDKESIQMCIEEGVELKFPDMNAAILAKHIDRGILYNLFLLGYNVS
jgi:hypothetical protein